MQDLGIEAKEASVRAVANLLSLPELLASIASIKADYVLRQQKIEKRLQILSDLRELASAESLDTFTPIYTNILEHHPDCPVEVVQKLVALREGIPRKDAKEVVQECREIYKNSFVDGNPPKPGFVFGKIKCLSASKGSLWRKTLM